MRLFMLLAVIFFVIALICVQVPTLLIGVSAAGWTVLGLLSMAIDFLLGGPVYGPSLVTRRQP